MVEEEKEFYVGVCMPWPGNKLMWDAVKDKDFLCPDLMAKARGVELPLLKVEAKDENEAVEKYKEEVPEVKDWKLVKGWEPA